MENNIFLLSDASYSDKSKVAGLGVVDTYSGVKYKTTVLNLNSAIESEFHALALSIKIAIQNNYANVVFVYDCKDLVLDELKQYVKDKFQSAQFLWLKRIYLSEADTLASTARKLTEKLRIKSATTVKKNLIKKTTVKLDTIGIFKKYSTRKKILAILTIANDREKEVLNSFLYSSKIEVYSNKGKILGVGTKKRTLMKFVYFILNDTSKRKFIEYLSHIEPNMNIKAFKKVIAKQTIDSILDTILHKLKNKRDI